MVYKCRGVFLAQVVLFLAANAWQCDSFHINRMPRSFSTTIAKKSIAMKADNLPRRTKGKPSPFPRAAKNIESDVDAGSSNTVETKRGLFALFSTIGFLYWYLMVFGAAAEANGLPVPDFLPMKPGWPASDADFQPVFEDSYHFFYLSEVLHNEDAPYVIPPRLAIFNFVEAWMFAMLPALWNDSQRRLPRSVLLGSWLLLGINLTNAFLAPYLAITELRSNGKEETVIAESESSLSFLATAFPAVFGTVATLVAGFALYQSVFVATTSDWSEFWTLVRTDRSYLAFCLDPVLFSVFQPIILERVKRRSDGIDYIPFVGLVAWLCSGNKDRR